MASIEYKTLIVKRPSGFSVQFRPPDLTGALNREAEDGWRLAQAFPSWLGSWDSFLLILERERTQKGAGEGFA